MRSMLFSPPWRKLLLTTHIAATVSVLGADLTLLTLGISGLSGSDQRAIYPAAHLISAFLVAPLAVLSLGTGLLLAVLTPWGLLKYWWVAIKLAITTALTGVVLLVLVPRLGAAAESVTATVPDLLTSGQRLPLAIAPAVASALLVVNIALAVFKPGWHLRSAAPTRKIDRDSSHEVGLSAVSEPASPVHGSV